MSNEKVCGSSSRRKLITFVVVSLHMLLLLVVFVVNGWFVSIEGEKTVQNESKNEEKKKDSKVSKAKDAKSDEDGDVKSFTFCASLERVTEKGDEPFQEKPESSNHDEAVARRASVPESVKNKQKNHKREEVKETPLEAPVENTDKKDEFVDGANNKLVEQDNPLEEFNYDEYENDLLAKYGVEEGEDLPVIFFENDEETYKEGLKFYGYNDLVARPVEFYDGEPFFYLIRDSAIERVEEEFPYNGVFPQALPEDEELFRKLLDLPDHVSESSDAYQLFYSPTLSTGAYKPLLSKQKMIIESIGKTVDEISRMTGSFRRIRDSFIVIINNVITDEGERIVVDDPDNGILLVRS